MEQLENETSQTLLNSLRSTGVEKEDAWRRFILYYRPVIHRYALRRIGKGEAEDLAQEVLRRLFIALPKFNYDREVGRFRGYLKTCTNTALADFLRRSAGPKTVSLTEAATAESSEADQAWELEWQRRRLEMAMDTVRRRYARRADSEKTFQAFEMSAVFGHSISAVCSELAMNAASVHAAKSRVLAALRDEIHKLAELLD